MMIWSRPKEAPNNKEDLPLRVKLALVGQVNLKLDRIVLNQDIVTFNPVVFANRSQGIAIITLSFQLL